MRNLLEYLEDTVLKFHKKTAFSDGREGISFGGLYDTARSIGTFLSEEGCSKEPVIIFMDKSAAELAAFLGVMYAGCYYVPVDREMPAERIRHILNMIPSRIILCDQAASGLLREKYLQSCNKNKIYLYEDIADFPVNQARLDKIRENHIDTDPAYIVFTSGSTGVPKGVIASHRSVIDYVEHLSDILQFGTETIFGNQAPFYVDACLKEIYPTLKFGASTYLIPRKKFMFPVELVKYLNEHKINTICWVVPALTMISSLGTFKTIKPEYLHTIAFGSEVFPVKQFNLWYETVPARYVNLYGPTECTGMSSYYEVKGSFQENEVIPIGRPFPNTDIFLAYEDGDGKMRVVDSSCKNQEGEIFIRGTCLTFGYFRDETKTKEAFIQNPLQNHYPELVYRTGDIGKYIGGELVFVSRKDNQIKHMGHRIELGEIEAETNKIEKILSCACIYVEESSRIMLYYTGEMESGELMGKLKEKLPAYMLPSGIIRMDKIPLTLNGKTDRKKLREIYIKQKER